MNMRAMNRSKSHVSVDTTKGSITIQARLYVDELADIARHFDKSGVDIPTQSMFLSTIVKCAYDYISLSPEFEKHDTLMEAYETLDRLGIIRRDIDTARHRRNNNTRELALKHETRVMLKKKILVLQKKQPLDKIQQEILDGLSDISVDVP